MSKDRQGDGISLRLTPDGVNRCVPSQYRQEREMVPAERLELPT